MVRTDFVFFRQDSHSHISSQCAVNICLLFSLSSSSLSCRAVVYLQQRLSLCLLYIFSIQLLLYFLFSVHSDAPASALAEETL